MISKPTSPTSPVKSSPPLIEDIINIILHYIFAQNIQRPFENRRRLAQYALISKAWRLPAQRLLFLEVSIRTIAQMESIRIATNSKTRTGRFLASCTMALKLRINGANSLGSIGVEHVASLMRLFPRLYQLRLETYRIYSVDNTILRALENTPPIQALMINRPSDGLRNTSNTEITKLHLQLLQVKRWRLRHFVLDGDLEVGSPPKSIPPPTHQFLEIRVMPIFSNEMAKSNLLNWLLKNSKDTIEVMAIPQYVPFIDRVAHRLRSLDCEFLSRLPEYEPLPLMRVEEFLWLSPHRINSPHVIPSTVVHLGFDMHQMIFSLKRWKELAPYLPRSLKHITVIRWVPALDDLNLERTEIEASLGGGIKVRLFTTINDFDKSWRFALVPGKKYPQTVSLDDFTTMSRLVNEQNARPIT